MVKLFRKNNATTKRVGFMGAGIAVFTVISAVRTLIEFVKERRTKRKK